MAGVRSSVPLVSPSPSRVAPDEDSRARGPWLWVAALAAAAGLCWLPFLGRTLSPDEGGLLTVAGQWAPGTSLYGDYWVDRPPVLIGLFAVADGMGGAPALRAMGVLAVVATVVLAGAIGRLVAGPRATTRRVVLPAATAALFVATPLFGGTVVSAELLGLPFVLAGIASALVSLDRPGRPSAAAWAAGAGAAGAAAFLVKQNIVDVFLFVLVVAVLRGGRGAGFGVTARLRLVGGAACGAVAVVALVLGVAAARGTSVSGVWDAVVVFRAQAAGIIAQSDNPAMGKRLGGVLVALVFSGAPVLAAALAWTSARRRGARARRTGLRSAAWAMLTWEMLVVLVGGGYWLHYLMGLVPGLVVLAAVSAPTRPSRARWLVSAYAYTACSTVAVLCWVFVHPIERPEEPAIAYLTAHARPGDSAVVAFGAPNILQGAGLQSPYPQLWSLPARVRDPEARKLTAVLAGPEAPTWLVVSGRSVTTWGIDGGAANRVVRSRYEPAVTAGNFRIFVRKDRR
ncbi:MAG: hypothetical protein ABWX84_02500 [Nocardioides sp.]